MKIKESLAERASTQKMFHDLNMKIIGNINGTNCRICGAPNCNIHR